MKRSFLILLSLLLGSCSIFLGNSKDLKSESYNVKFNKSSWKEMDPDLSDLAFQNESSGSIILFNSLCKKYDDSSLNNLQKNLLSGLDNLNILQTSDVSLYNRKANKVNATARLDGVLVYLDVYTVKKNRCVYDFVLIGNSESNIQKDRADFKNFLDQMRIN